LDRKPVEIEELLPLKPDVFTVLLVLLDGDAHGYAMMKAAEERTGRPGSLQPGALYRLLRQMLELELVVEVPDEQVPASADSRRRYYRITDFGRSVAAAEARRMAELVEASRHHRLLDEAETT
jgi:DNA-binding PadR family transcriptional regulator